MQGHLLINLVKNTKFCVIVTPFEDMLTANYVIASITRVTWQVQEHIMRKQHR